MTTDQDRELEEWRREWQSLGGAEGFATELVQRAARDGKKMKRAAAYEVLAAIFSTSVCVWLLVRTHGSIEIASLMALILLFNGAWLMQFFTVRATLFDAAGATVEAFVTLTRKRLETERRWTRYAQRWMLVLGFLISPWMIWIFVTHRDAYLAAPWRAFVGFGGAAAIFAAVVLFARRKAKRLAVEEERFERQVAEAQLE